MTIPRRARAMALRAGAIAMMSMVPRADASAQIDYRNLDDDRPTRVEDAYPVERYAFEVIAPWRYARSTGFGLHAFIPEIEYGLLRNFQVGLKLPIAGVSTPSGRDWGISGLRLFGLYNFNTESPSLPAFSIRADAVFPVGELAGEGLQLTAKGIATRSWGKNRLHVNGAYTFGSPEELAAVEAADKWWVGAAVDRTLFRQSSLLIAELYALRSTPSEPIQVNASVGLRYQWGPMTVVDVGVSRRLRYIGPDYEITFGVSRALGVAALLPSRR